MDVLTHFLVPFAAALYVLGFGRAGRLPAGSAARGHRMGLALAFGLAGFAPDIDSLYTSLKTVPGLWWLQHRGVSHSLMGAPLHAYAVLGLGHLLAVYFPRRFGIFVWRRGFFTAGLLGSWSHLLLDGVTLAGVPALFPFADGRWTLSVFSWLVIWLFPLIAVYLAAWAWTRWEPAWTARLGVVVIVILVVLAGVRLHYRPDVPDGGYLAGTEDPLTWVVLCPFENKGSGWTGYVARFPCAHEVAPGAPVGYEAWVVSTGWNGPLEARMVGTYQHSIAAAVDEEVLQRVQNSSEHAGYQMGSFGPTVYSVEPWGDQVRVTVTDVLQVVLVEEKLVEWTPAKPMEHWGRTVIDVDPDGTMHVVQRGW